MKRVTLFVVIIVVIAVFLFGGTAALAVSRSSHYDSAYSNALGGSATLKVTQCCEYGKPDSYVRVRLTAKPVLATSSDTYYSFGNASSGKTALSHTSSKSLNSNNQVLATSHSCFAYCEYCESQFGSKTKYHHS